MSELNHTFVFPFVIAYVFQCGDRLGRYGGSYHVLPADCLRSGRTVNGIGLYIHNIAMIRHAYDRDSSSPPSEPRVNRMSNRLHGSYKWPGYIPEYLLPFQLAISYPPLPLDPRRNPSNSLT